MTNNAQYIASHEITSTCTTSSGCSTNISTRQHYRASVWKQEVWMDCNQDYNTRMMLSIHNIPKSSPFESLLSEVVWLLWLSMVMRTWLGWFTVLNNASVTMVILVLEELVVLMFPFVTSFSRPRCRGSSTCSRPSPPRRLLFGRRAFLWWLIRHVNDEGRRAIKDSTSCETKWWLRRNGFLKRVFTRKWKLFA